MSVKANPQIYKAYTRMTKAFSEFSYKPGWKFKIMAEDETTLFIMLECPAKDLKTKKAMKIQVGETIPVAHVPNMEEARLMAAYVVPKLIDVMEEHEKREWLTYKGKHLINPHPGTPGYKGRTAFPETLAPMMKAV